MAEPVKQQGWVSLAVSRFERPLAVYAGRLLGDEDRARDIVQETFLKLCRQDPSEVEGHLAEWLFTVCRNCALDVLRKEGRMSRLTEEQTKSQLATAPAPSEVLERREEAARALELLEGLPPNQREVLRLKFQNGFSYKEISRISGHSVTNVGFLIHVGLKTIRQKMAVELSRPASTQG